MPKIILSFFLFVSTLLAQSYNFTELRYSDATGRFTELEGIMDFTSDGLDIRYPKSKRELKYSDDTLVFLQNNKKVAIKESQATQMMQYFDILKMLHAGDESELKDYFTLEKSADTIVLHPTNSIKYYIDKIELTKENKQLKHVKLFLKNSDYITINIENEAD
jgi:hypothetical protein